MRFLKEILTISMPFCTPYALFFTKTQLWCRIAKTNFPHCLRLHFTTQGWDYRNKHGTLSIFACPKLAGSNCVWTWTEYAAL